MKLEREPRPIIQNESEVNKIVIAEPTFDIPRKGGRISWSKLLDQPEKLEAVIEYEASKFVSLGHSLTDQGLRGAKGYVNLHHIVYSLYPGGISALRVKIGLPRGIAAQGYWQDLQRIEQESQTFFQEYGRFTLPFLKKNGRGDLANAITSYYPGGIKQTKVFLGIITAEQAENEKTTKRKEMGFWSDERLEKEALEFYQTYGKLTVSELIKRNRKDLAFAIARRKSGFKMIKQKLGIKLGRKDNYWTQEQIEMEAEMFIKEYGSLTQNLLALHNRSDFIHAIRRHYPGQMKDLKEKIGNVAKNDQEQRIFQDDADEALGRLIK